MNNDNSHSEGGSAPPRAIDNTRIVYEVAVTYSVKAKLYVLAHDRNEAVVLAEKIELDDLIGFNDTQIWIDDEDRIEFDDIESSMTGVAEPANGRDPAEHPDWFPEVTR